MSILERIQTKCKELGPQAAADLFGESVLTIRKWERGEKKPTFDAIDRLLANEEAIADKIEIQQFQDGPVKDLAIEEAETCREWKASVEDQITNLKQKVRVPENATAPEILQAAIEGRWSRKVVLLTPFNRDINPNIHFNIVALLRKCPWMGYQYKTNTIIQRARNLLAHDFLNSEAEWSLWMDSDMVLSFGDPGFIGIKMKGTKVPVANASINTPERLMSHGKTIVGGVYARRGVGDGLCIQPALHPQNDEDRALAKRLEQGPTNELHKVGYIATGCALVHRKVYEDIMALRPELAAKKEGEAFDFFGSHKTNEQGEDIFFFRMAAEAGHQSFLDGGVFCGHLGIKCYFPGDS